MSLESRKWNDFLFYTLINLIDRFLYLDGLLNTSNDLAIGLYLIQGKYPSLSVLQPFVTDLITANPIIPFLRCYAFKVLRFIDIKELHFAIIIQFLYLVISLSLKPRNR